MTRLCSSCGRPITRGDTGNGGAWQRCLVCRVAADLADWRYDPPTNQRKRSETYRAARRAAYAARKVRRWSEIARAAGFAPQKPAGDA